MNENQSRDHLIKWLFATKALRVSEPEQPFWYTAGTIGPYYVNTHFLFGDERAAGILLETIEDALQQPETGIRRISQAVGQQYAEHPVYRGLMDLMVRQAASLSFDLISGGERRDLFFSLQLAELLSCDHATILKDQRLFIHAPGEDRAHRVAANALSGRKVLHVADLVTEASSYLRAWLPAIRRTGMTIEDTLAVIDRNQGGEEILAREGVKLHSLIRIDDPFLSGALQNGQINSRQKEQIQAFMADPHRFMQAFFQEHPDFLRQQLDLGGKNRERARLCISQGYGAIEDDFSRN